MKIPLLVIQLLVRAVLTAFLFHLFYWLRFYYWRVNLGLFLNVSFTRSAMCQRSKSLCKSTWDWAIFTTHAVLHISSKCRSSRMIRRTVGNSTMGWISALGIPMFTSVQLLQNHMKPLRILANRTGAFCSALFLPEWATCGSFPQYMSSLTIGILPTWTILTPHCSIGLQWQPVGPAVLAFRALLKSSVTWFSSLSARPVVFIWSTTHGQAPSS